MEMNLDFKVLEISAPDRTLRTWGVGMNLEHVLAVALDSV